MSDDNTQNELSAEEQQVSELDLLKQRATLLGISFSPNIGVETLRERIATKQAELESAQNQESQTTQANPLIGQTAQEAEAPVKTKSLRQHLIDENMKLVRLRITNLDPKKKDLKGEIFTVANEFLGTVRKFVPYGEDTDEGYHVPYCIYKMLDKRKFLEIKTWRNKATGQQEVSQRWVREFSLEVLEPLTEKELATLAAAQAAAGSIG
ncbi:hypothetical protein HYP85_gp093 [Pseudomonas phage Zuri]|uniref:Uncharacterized protein n=1 Tax=Pseudomonas phage Zuri TaxID=2604899 RepID=A0A5C1K5P9_9CAUD|nr:hypothetical protein HYP85_gp093 [Pseudomonas phage Zuri]QEM41173.1 hypothetical protein Zuri_80 [Pseudomonas phage Zuri]